MWKIIKADFNYQKFVFIIPYAVVIAAIIANISQGWHHHEHDMQGVRTVMAVMTGIIFLFNNLLKIIQEKRYRFIMLLPLSRWKIAWPRIFFAIIIWVSFLVMYWLGTATIRPYPSDILIWDTLSFTGLVLFANSIIFIYYDLLYTITKNSHKLILWLTLLLLVFIGYVVFFLFGVDEQSWNIFKNLLLPYKDDFSSITSNYVGAVVSLLIGIIMTMLSVYVFGRRKTYTQ